MKDVCPFNSICLLPFLLSHLNHMGSFSLDKIGEVFYTFGKLKESGIVWELCGVPQGSVLRLLLFNLKVIFCICATI